MRHVHVSGLAMAALFAGCAQQKPAEVAPPERAAQAPLPSTYMKTPWGETLPLPVILDAQIIDRDPACYAVDLDGDERQEIIVEWVVPEGDPRHCYRIYRQGDGGAYHLRAAFELEGGVVGGIGFFREPDPMLPWRAVIGIHGGAGWGTLYAVRPDGTGADEVARPMRHEHRDLDGDGVYEWIVFNKHNEIMELRGDAHAPSIEVYRWAPASQRYHKEWPRPEHGLLACCAVVCDIDGDGAQEILALMDAAVGSPETRRLCVHEIGAAGDEPSAQIAVARSTVPWDILPLRNVGGLARIPLAISREAPVEYEYRDGALRRVAPEQD